MTGRHLRRARWRTVLAVVGVLLLGVAIGAGSTVLQEIADDDVATDGDRATLVPETGPVTIALTGEVRPGWGLAGLAGPSDAREGLADLVVDADLVVAQLVAAVVDEEPPEPGDAAWVPTEALDTLGGAGIDVVSLATERGLDLGPGGLDATLRAAAGRAVAVAGIGADEDAAYAPVLRRLGGQTVAVIAATQLLAADRIASDTARPGVPGLASAKRVDRLVAEVAAAREAADIVIVLVHWGDPGATCPSVAQQELATALVQAGADVVAGAGAGRVQGAGRLAGSLVGYGLGALVDDGAQEGGALLVRIDGGQVVDHSWAPAQLVDGIARPLRGGDAEAAVAEWEARRECTGLEP